MKKHILLVALLCGLQCFGWAGSQPQISRKTLHEPAEIQGYPCAKGFAWFYTDGRLERCTVSRDTAFGEVQVPAGSIIVLRPNGKPEYVMLIHNSPIRGYICDGGGPLGPAEGAMTSLYASGKLRVCWLARDQIVQGVPCKAAGGFFNAIFHHGGFYTDFHESGKLHSCTLSEDFGGLRQGQVFTQAP